MFANKTELIGFVLNVIQLTQNSFAFFISLIVIIIIIYHMCTNRMKRDVKITLILCANIYILIFLLMIVLVQMNVQTLMGNLYGREFDTFWCMFIGYLAPVIFYTLYHGFVNQVSLTTKCLQLFHTDRTHSLFIVGERSISPTLSPRDFEFWPDLLIGTNPLYLSLLSLSCNYEPDQRGTVQNAPLLT
jgi:hypothetical protein